MEVSEAFSLIERAVDTGHAANGYLIAGDKRLGLELVDLVLRKLFPNELEQIAAKCHPDVAYLEPEGRVIPVALMRERIVAPMAVTAFSGGWKVGVIVGADRMEAPTANAFLKSLEEPPPKTMYLLVTDSPDAILPTIVSRSQRIDLPLADDELTGDLRASVSEVFEYVGTPGVYERAKLAENLASVLSGLLELAEEEQGDPGCVRKTFFRTVLACVAAWMKSGRVAAYLAYRNIAAVEDAYRQVERAVPVDAALSFMMDRLVFPVK